ncbi:MAG TPA: Calx-beta domain-containing protein [Pirellulaceae bacterium]|nr:Calx-beta domain-containing protein [Pirellulaceae bacterium]
MFFHSWLRPVAHNRTRTHSHKPRSRHLHLEQLEERKVLSYDFGYALGLGSAGIDVGTAVAVDSAANVAVAGFFSNEPIDLDPGPGSYILPNDGGADGFAAQYDPLGNLRWGVHFGSAASNGATEAAVDGAGNTFVAGWFTDSVQIGAPGATPVTLSASGGIEGLLAKIDPAGNVLWARTLGEDGLRRRALGIALDSAGNVYATGEVQDTKYMYIAMYDGSSGATVWSHAIKDGTGINHGGYVTFTSGSDVAVDASGNVVVTGSYMGTIDFNPDPAVTNSLTNSGTTESTVNVEPDVFVLKLNAAGGYLWAGSMGSTGYDGAGSVATDGTGNAYVTGWFESLEGDADPGPGKLMLPAGRFMVKLDPSENLIWGRSMVVGYFEVDAAGSIYSTSGFSGTIDADPGPGTFNLTSAGSNDVLVSKFDSAGNFVWAASMGGTGSDIGRAIALDGDGNIYTTGSFQATADFDPGAGVYNLTSTLDANGNTTSDVFISKLVPTDGGETLPVFSISDVSVVEGNSGTVSAVLTVTLSAASDQTVTVDFATADGTATAGSDYQAVSGTLTILAGQTVGMISVPVNGDRVAEANEIFFMNLGNATNATIADGQGVGTIVDDEPRISISDVSKSEGKRGKTTLFTFTVTLSAAYDQAVTMSFKTVDGTATTSDKDYKARSGTLTFNPGETTKTITIEIIGDSKKEANETFYLDLYGLSSNALFTKSRGLGTILNDD